MKDRRGNTMKAVPSLKSFVIYGVPNDTHIQIVLETLLSSKIYVNQLSYMVYNLIYHRRYVIYFSSFFATDLFPLDWPLFSHYFVRIMIIENLFISIVHDQ